MTGTKQTHKKKRHEKELGGTSRLLLAALRSAFISLLVSILLAALISGIAQKSDDALSVIAFVALAVLYLSSFLSGFLCMNKTRESTLLCGVLGGTMFMVLYIFISLFLPNEFSTSRSFWLSLLLRLLMIAFSVLGSYAAKSRFAKKRKRRK